MSDEKTTNDDLQPQGVPAGGSTLSSDDAPTSTESLDDDNAFGENPDIETPS